MFLHYSNNESFKENVLKRKKKILKYALLSLCKICYFDFGVKYIYIYLFRFTLIMACFSKMDQKKHKTTSSHKNVNTKLHAKENKCKTD